MFGSLVFYHFVIDTLHSFKIIKLIRIENKNRKIIEAIWNQQNQNVVRNCVIRAKLNKNIGWAVMCLRLISLRNDQNDIISYSQNESTVTKTIALNTIKILLTHLWCERFSVLIYALCCVLRKSCVWFGVLFSACFGRCRFVIHLNYVFVAALPCHCAIVWLFWYWVAAHLFPSLYPIDLKQLSISFGVTSLLRLQCDFTFEFHKQFSLYFFFFFYSAVRTEVGRN